MSGPWYVEESGKVFTFHIHSPDTIMLSDGRVLNPDHESGEMYATEEAARLRSELFRVRAEGAAKRKVSNGDDGEAA